MTNGFSRDLSVINPRNLTARGLPAYLEKASLSTRYDFLTTAARTGIATDGRVAFRMTPADVASVQQAVAGRAGRAGGETVSLQALGIYFQPSKGRRYSDAVIIGAQPPHRNPHNQLIPDAYLVENTLWGGRAALDARFVRMIQARYPDATIQVADEKTNENAARFLDGGQIIGVIMTIVAGAA